MTSWTPGAAGTRDITLRYHAVDGHRTTRVYKTIETARAYAQKMLGECPELGQNYAVSGDGVGTITAEGCTLIELFPRLVDPLTEARIDAEISAMMKLAVEGGMAAGGVEWSAALKHLCKLSLAELKAERARMEAK